MLRVKSWFKSLPKILFCFQTQSFPFQDYQLSQTV